MELPDTLYERLPYLYLLIGLLGTLLSVAVGSLLAFICGATLIAASRHIFKMRREYRRSQYR